MAPASPSLTACANETGDVSVCRHGRARSERRMQLHRRVGGAPSNFERLVPADDSELMQQMVNDPYKPGVLTLERDAAERDLERALVIHIERFLLELGTGHRSSSCAPRLT